MDEGRGVNGTINYLKCKAMKKIITTMILTLGLLVGSKFVYSAQVVEEVLVAELGETVVIRFDGIFKEDEDIILWAFYPDGTPFIMNFELDNVAFWVIHSVPKDFEGTYYFMNREGVIKLIVKLIVLEEPRTIRQPSNKEIAYPRGEILKPKEINLT